ncbi:MAG: cupin domain-containing protein [Candidatus Saccharibacteria bacterium]|nr:cupin domain-containing protein [Candidatus Saccharibacteria bacterium]
MRNLDKLSFEPAGSYARAPLYDEGGNRVQVVKVPPKATVRPHYHEQRTEVFIILRGQGRIMINDQIAARNVHDFAICRPQDVHAVVNEGDDDMLIGVSAFGYQQGDSTAAKEE